MADDRGSFFSPRMGGKCFFNFPPRVSKSGGGGIKIPPQGPEIWGGNKNSPGGKNRGVSPEESEIPQKIRLRRAIFQKSFVWFL